MSWHEEKLNNSKWHFGSGIPLSLSTSVATYAVCKLELHGFLSMNTLYSPESVSSSAKGWAWELRGGEGGRGIIFDDYIFTSWAFLYLDLQRGCVFILMRSIVPNKKALFF